jgi:hypothetical protein
VQVAADREPDNMRLFVLVSFIISAGCVVGDPTPGREGDDDSSVVPDGGGDPGPGPDGGGNNAECEPAAATTPNGYHNPGLPCLTCHAGQQPTAPVFTVAGTLYNSAQGTAGVTAATMTITDATGTAVKVTTGTNGNFWTSQAVTLPLTVSASKCPDTKRMNAQPQTGDCNGCHTAQAAQGRIHLP